MCQNDLALVFLCGINEEEFGNLYLGRKEGGFEESDYSPKQTIIIDSQPSGVYLCNLYNSYKPVVCETTTEWNIPSQEIFPNICAAKTIGGFDDDENQCTCYEFKDLVYLMKIIFGEENCDYATPRPASEEDAQLWYSCSTNGNKDTKTRSILGADMISTGFYGETPIPASFIVHINTEESSTTVPPSNSIGFRNDCTDHQRAEMMFKLYNQNL